jgi:hypothetical protein
MTRIEKTKINCSAFMILTAALKNAQSEKIIEIVNDGSSVTFRPKKEEEKDEFYIDLTFLDKLANKLLMTDHSPLLVTGDAEKYLRNCSFACFYFRKENERFESFDPFEIFHEIHFPKIENNENELILLNQFCLLFRIDYSNCLTFINNSKESNLLIQLPAKKHFNDIFESINIYQFDKSKEIVFESYKLTMMDSLDTLFSIKDLLFSKGIDTSIIPEYHIFGIEQYEEVHYNFSNFKKQRIEITFRYDYVRFRIEEAFE